MSVENFPVTIYFNPTCSNARNALALLQARGIESTVIEYLKTPPSRTQLVQLIADSGEGARGILRSKESLCAELGLNDPTLSDDALVDAMVAHPILMNRPLVVTPLGTRLCRPPERVQEILPPQA
jgi:arsenate reductase